ncbi:MAG: hypothetical protein JXB88_10990 [Spirochaetales bacterium]|nr:hypothetical protein [Spirochaetales bacterium]
MVRIEIFANRSVEQTIFTELKRSVDNFRFSQINGVYGMGNTIPKMGNHTWPEENFVLIIYCSPEEEKNIKSVITRVKEIFPGEGIKYFTLRSSRE